jgi:hypothetical protein
MLLFQICNGALLFMQMSVHPLLSATEEKDLSELVQGLMRCEEKKEEIEAVLGRPISEKEWAEAMSMTVNTLTRTLKVCQLPSFAPLVPAKRANILATVAYTNFTGVYPTIACCTAISVFQVPLLSWGIMLEGECFPVRRVSMHAFVWTVMCNLVWLAVLIGCCYGETCVTLGH